MKRTKTYICKTLIRPELLYAADTVRMTKKDEAHSRILERKILSTILGPIKITEEEYRIRTNDEIKEELKKDIKQKFSNTYEFIEQTRKTLIKTTAKIKSRSTQRIFVKHSSRDWN